MKKRCEEMNKLKPCPFCGGEASLNYNSYLTRGYQCICGKCGASAEACTLKDMVMQAELEKSR